MSATDICPGWTAHAVSNAKRWGEQDVCLKFWETGLLECDGLKKLDWSWISADGALDKVPLNGGKPVLTARIGAKAA